MAFLPATAVASIFSVNVINWSNNPVAVYNPAFYIFLVFLIIVTIVVLIVYVSDPSLRNNYQYGQDVILSYNVEGLEGCLLTKENLPGLSYTDQNSFG